MLVRSSLSYYNFGLSQNIGVNNWRKEFSPSGELSWRHPYFGMGMMAQRRTSSSNDLATSLVTDYYSVNFRSRWAKYPYVNLQVQQGNAFSKPNRGERDTRDQAIVAGVGYSTRNSNLSYGLTRRDMENRTDRREQIDYQHSLRLSHAQFLHGQAVRISASYNLDYRTQSDITPASSNVPREIPLSVGLYANDATPDLGSLDTIPALVDSSLLLPTSPPINIGNGNVNWNLGVDFGFTRSVNKIYVYTDRLSGSSVRWQAYKSEDNVVWTPIPSTTSLYNVGFSRYEVSFPSTTTRYVKVVNTGLNEIAEVFVTEIQALIDIGNQSEIKRQQTVHLATLSNTFRLSSKVTSGADIFLRRESGSSLAALRNETMYNVNTRYEISKTMATGIRGELGFIDYKRPSTDIDKLVSVSYDFQYKPLPTLAFLLSLLSRHNYIKSMKAQEINNASVRATGDPLERLHASTELGWSQNDLHQLNLIYDTWTYRLAINGGVIRSLDAAINYFYQRTEEAGSAKSRSKNQYAADLSWRVSRNIVLQGNVNLTQDFQNRYLTQDYSVSWSASPKLNVSAAAYLTQLQDNSHSNRYNVQLQYSLTARSVIMASYSDNDQSFAGGNSIAVLQVGLRTAF